MYQLLVGCLMGQRHFEMTLPTQLVVATSYY